MSRWRVLATLFQLLILCIVVRHGQTQQSSTTAKPKRTPTTLSYREMQEKWKKKHNIFDYNPNFGYEPYWADGEWVLTTRLLQPGETTTKVPTICGDECHYLLRRIKEVCGRLSSYTEVHGCSGLRCTGWPGDDMNPAFKTFKTYCEFLDWQCRSKFYQPKRWVLVHLGPCLKVDNHFKPLWASWWPVSRMDHYLSSFYLSYETSSTHNPDPWYEPTEPRHKGR